MSGFNDFVQTELPKRPFVDTDGAAGQALVRSSNPLAARELVWVDLAAGQSYVASVSMGGHTLVQLTANNALAPADSNTVGGHVVLGILEGAVVAGASASVLTHGSIEHLGWSWTPGSPVFLGVGGTVVQTLDSGALFCRVVGLAVSPTRVSIDIQPAIFF